MSRRSPRHTQIGLVSFVSLLVLCEDLMGFVLILCEDLKGFVLVLCEDLMSV